MQTFSAPSVSVLWVACQKYKHPAFEGERGGKWGKIYNNNFFYTNTLTKMIEEEEAKKFFMFFFSCFLMAIKKGEKRKNYVGG